MSLSRIVKDQKHRVRLELTSPHYGCGILAAGRPVLAPNQTFVVGPEGLEPSPTWLRARHAAANTLIPSFVTRRERLLDWAPGTRCRLPLVALIVTIGVGRTRTLTLQIKSLLCCRYTTTPCEGCVRLSRVCICRITTISFARSFKGPRKSLGVELNHRFRLIRATCFRYTTERCTFFFNESGWSESNRLSRVPKTRGRPVPFIPSLFLRSSSSGPYGSRTHLPALKGRYPRTDRRTSRFVRAR